MHPVTQSTIQTTLLFGNQGCLCNLCTQKWFESNQSRSCSDWFKDMKFFSCSPMDGSISVSAIICCSHCWTWDGRRWTPIKLSFADANGSEDTSL